MLKSCRQLSMTVRSPALGPTSCAGSGPGSARASCSWMDRQGRPASPPPAHTVSHPTQRYGGFQSRSASKDRSIRRVDLCIEPGQSLGLMIRGGLEYNLGIYITGVDKDSVADRAGLMIGDQILEVNGQSFLEVTHDEAVAQLKYHKRMSLLVKDVGKVPHSCTAYGDRTSHEVHPCEVQGSPSRSLLGVRSAAAAMVEEKARSILATGELPALLYHMDEYVSQRLRPDHFVTVVLEMLNTPDKYTLLTELREFMHPEDRSRFDEIVYRRELGHDHHVRRKGGTENHHMMMSSTMHELRAPELTEGGGSVAGGSADAILEHRSPSEDSGLGLAAHDHGVRQGGARPPAPVAPWSHPPTEHSVPEDEAQDGAQHQEYCSNGSAGGRRSRRHSSPANSREGSTTALHQLGYDDPDQCGYLEGLRSSLGGWTQKVKSWYWGRPLELAHKLSRSFDMKEESGALLGEGAGGSGIRRHQSMQRLQSESMMEEIKPAKVVSDHHGNLHITVKKTKPILGIAIEGGANTKHPLPRIINIHEHGAAHAAGGLEVGQLILAVDGRRVDGMPHQDVARLIAEAFAQRDKQEIEFLVVEAKKSNLEPKPTALIFLEA